MKTNLQKMLDGEAYDSRDPELLELYHRARALILAYNTCDSRDLDRRNELISQLLGKVAKGVWIETPFFCDYGINIEIGENTFVNTNCMFLDDNKITIGKNGLIAPYVRGIKQEVPKEMFEICSNRLETAFCKKPDVPSA